MIRKAVYCCKKFATKIRRWMSNFLHSLKSLDNLRKLDCGVLRCKETRLNNMLGIASSSKLSE